MRLRWVFPAQPKHALQLLVASNNETCMATSRRPEDPELQLQSQLQLRLPDHGKLVNEGRRTSGGDTKDMRWRVGRRRVEASSLGQRSRVASTVPPEPRRPAFACAFIHFIYPHRQAVLGVMQCNVIHAASQPWRNVPLPQSRFTKLGLVPSTWLA
jgi:hypothetical protein